MNQIILPLDEDYNAETFPLQIPSFITEKDYLIIQKNWKKTMKMIKYERSLVFSLILLLILSILFFAFVFI